MIAYYAHCMLLYGSPQEVRDVLLLKSLGWDVINPSDEKWKAGWDAYSMDYMPTVMEGTQVVAFRALQDGRIPSGIAKELAYAREQGWPIIELPNRILGRQISLEETREYLKEVGQR